MQFQNDPGYRELSGMIDSSFEVTVNPEIFVRIYFRE